jgi:TP901-1 family phage major tail protein
MRISHNSAEGQGPAAQCRTLRGRELLNRCGLRARTLVFNAATVDVADTESVGRWRELLDGAGVKTARITGSGIFNDAATDETVRQYFFTGWVGA